MKSLLLALGACSMLHAGYVIFPVNKDVALTEMARSMQICKDLKEKGLLHEDSQALHQCAALVASYGTYKVKYKNGKFVATDKRELLLKKYSSYYLEEHMFFKN